MEHKWGHEKKKQRTQKSPTSVTRLLYFLGKGKLLRETLYLEREQVRQ